MRNTMSKTKAVEIDKLLAMVRQDMEVLAVIIFGSAVRQEKTPLSDVDLCLVMMPLPQRSGPTGLSYKRLEYMKDNSLDVRIFQQLPLYIRVRVLKEGRILFVRDEDQLYELAFRTAQAFEDFKHIYYGYLKEVELAG
jgi:predicted nucleotidyltransferase